MPEIHFAADPAHSSFLSYAATPVVSRNQGHVSHHLLYFLHIFQPYTSINPLTNLNSLFKICMLTFVSLLFPLVAVDAEKGCHILHILSAVRQRHSLNVSRPALELVLKSLECNSDIVSTSDNYYTVF